MTRAAVAAGLVSGCTSAVSGVPAEDIERVECPADQKVKVGNMFTCEVRIGGQQKVVDIKVRTADSANEYEVGTPRDK